MYLSNRINLYMVWVSCRDLFLKEAFSETKQNTYFERLLSINSPLDRGHVLPFGSPAWKGHVPLTDMMILHVESFRTDALRRFTAPRSWVGQWA